MVAHHIILAILWIIYGVLHSVLAATTVKKWAQHTLHIPPAYYRILYTIFAFVSLALLVWFQLSLRIIEVFPTSLFSFFAGLLIGIPGLVLMAVCIRKYFFSLSGLRSLFVENAKQPLEITGIHRFVRHPLYLGTFLFIWGLFLVLPQLSLLISNAIIMGYTLVGMGLEEKKLIRDFGQDYRRYQEKVPRLIPYFKTRKQPEKNPSS
jgi:methanethiol S-methyltransferase